MKKVVVALGLYKLTIPQKIESGRTTVTSMTGNPNFPTPSPALTLVTAACNGLETAYIAAKSGGRDETAAMYVKEQALDLLMKSLGGYVETTANNNPASAEAIVLSAGINLKKNPVARANGFRLKPGELPGQIIVRTDADKRAIYTWEMTTTPGDESSWLVIGSGTKAQFLATDLTSGTRYYFRVAKTDKNGQGPYSNVLDMIAA